MSAHADRIPSDMLREAAARLAHAHAAGVRPEDDLALNAWRRQSRAHESAFLHATRAWEHAGALRSTPGYADLLGRPSWRERWVAVRRQCGQALSSPSAWRLRGWAMACAVVLLVGSVGGYRVLRGPDHRTLVAEVREIPLEDGSVVTLGGRSALDVDFASGVRLVRLRGGEAFFSVAHDPARPFVVMAGDTAIRVLGTRFNVNFDAEGARARVVVEQGVVEVMQARDVAADAAQKRVEGGTPLRLTAGQQALVKRDLPVPQKAEPVGGIEAGSWRQGRLSYRDATLAEIVADANRYRSAPIRIAVPELGERRITTSFRTSQIEQLLDTLPDTLSLTVLRRQDGSVDLEPLPNRG